MKLLTTFGVILCLLFVSCSRNENNALALIENLLTQVNDDIENNIDTSFFSDSYLKYFDQNKLLYSKDWKLSLVKINDSIFIVNSKGSKFEDKDFADYQEFKLILRNNNLKLIDSNNFLSFSPSFNIKGKNWNRMWDTGKNELFELISKNITAQYMSWDWKFSFENQYNTQVYYRIVNNSDYAIENIKVLIEGYDNKGNSIFHLINHFNDVVPPKSKIPCSVEGNRNGVFDKEPTVKIIIEK